MKKFFTLCLAFMLASLLNVNAADTYTLVGNDVNGKSWDTSATINDFVYDSTTETYVLSGAKVNGEFKVVKNHNWGDGELAANPYNPNVLTNTAYRMYYNGQDGASSNANTKSALENCTVKLQFVGDDKTPFITFETESEQSWSWNDNVSTNWGIIGADELIGAWGPDVDLTCNYNSTYTWKTEKLPEGEFKFRENDAWDVNFGAGPVSNIDVNTEVSLGYNTGNMKFNTPTENYSFYVFTLTIRGGAAKLRVDGFKEIVGSTEIFYESFDQCNGTGANDGNGFGDTDSGVASSTFTADNDGWNASKKYAASKSAKFGNSTAGNGVVTSPALGLEGDGTLTFKAAPWNNDGTELNLSISSGTLSETKVTMTKGEWTEFTVKITGATADATLTFTPAKRFFLDEVKVTQGEGETPTWAPVFNDVANGGIYYGNYVNYSVDAPGCDKLDLKFYKNGEFDWETSQPSQYLPYSNSANCATDASWNNITTEHEIIATAYKGNEFYTTTIKFTVQPVESVKTLNEFIGTEGKRIFIQQMATVTYQSGKYLYLKDNSGAIVVYGDGLPTFEPGDLLQNFVAEYTNYNGLHEIIPVASSFKNAKLGNWGAPSPELITIEDVTVANQSKYIKLNGVELDGTAKTIGDVAMFNQFGIELPADGKYNVTAIIGMYKGAVQLYPILIEEIPTLAPTAVSPEDATIVGSLNTVTLTFPENVSLNTEAGEITCIGTLDSYNKATIEVKAEGSSVIFTMAETSEYWAAGETYKLTIPAGYIIGTSGSVNEELTYSWTISDEPVYELNYASVSPVAGEVESLSEFYLVFDEKVKNNSSASATILVDSEGNQVATGTLSRYDETNTFNSKYIKVTLDKAVTTPGTYKLVIPQGSIGDYGAYDVYYFNKGRLNPEYSISYTIPEPPITYTYLPKSVSPADGSTVDAPLKHIRLAMGYDTEIKGGAYSSTEYISIVNQNGERVFEGTARIELETQYYYYIYIYPNGDEGITEPGTYTFTIPAGCIGDEDIYYSRWTEGKVNPELTYTFTVKGSAMQVSAVAPEEGETADLNTITLTFPEATTFAAEASALTFHNDNYYNATVKSVVMSEDGLTATITSEAGYPGWMVGESYTLNIPEGAFVGASGAATEALSYTWTIATPAPETFSFTEVTPTQGEVESLSEILIDFGGFRPRPVEGWSYPSYNILDANGNIVTTAATNYSYENLDGTYYYKLKATLGKTVTDPGTYTLTIPAGAFKDLEASSGYKVNEEIVLSWTIKAPAMQVSTVAPEEGETADLNTITLTFPEATTFAAEASALTFHNDNYYTASVKSVVMSEDGLTATITSEAGYPGWKLGESYTLNIPEGAFVGASGAATEALSYTWTIAVEKFTYVSVTPAQGEVTELSEILICFAHEAYGNSLLPTLNLIDEYGAVITTASTTRAQDADGNWYAIKATLAEKVTAAGTYILQVPEDVFKDTDFGDGNTNKAFNLKWIIDSNTYTLALNIDPADGSTVTALDKISFTPGAGVMVAMATNEALTDNWFTVTDAQGNTYNSKLALEGTGYALTIEGATAAGTYTVLVPKKSFYDALNATNFNAEMTLTYTVDANKYDFEWTVNPAEGEVTELTKLTFLQANAGEMLYPTNQALSDNWVKVVDAEGNSYNTRAIAGNGYEVTIEGATAAGTYTVTVPKGSFYDMMASMAGTMNFNSEIVLTYTIAAPEDFTPVVTPTAGSVEVKDLSSIIVTLPSEFGEFNPKCHSWYDQMYIKYYDESLGYDQEIWTKTNSSITVSEDGLSITLTDWAFEFEKGVTYKFNIPAGYIVLANGAKNAETCIEYVISEGPKDLAEFTVPAGINGYINYDETNINAWAPEFPFTVSTTQNNTIAFSATLPSLPTGLTSMEVLDENGEVLVTLNQTGVAPLADGTEEYYVAGETTKEFVDGATLRFYFSFAHAGGISETIRFEYVVAGGTITGAEAITLDGNVIVRGNDIIAPEGSAIYTVSGIQVPAEGLAPGVYVVVYGNQAIKVMVK